MTTFMLPDLGEGLAEAEIVAWHVSPGDHVVADAPLVSVETDKAVVEVPAPYSGTIGTLHVAPGDLVETGAPLVDIATADAPDIGAIVGDLTGGKEPPRPRAQQHADNRSVRAAPAVRRLAETLGVDLAGLVGSGPGGAILSDDVEAAAGATKTRPLRGVRRTMAKTMAASGVAVVPATLTDLADIHRWPEVNRPMLRLIRAVVAGCTAEPALNASFDGERRSMSDSVDLAIAVDADQGLFAPVLAGVDTTPPGELAMALDSLIARVESRTLSRGELFGGTITLSNFGTMGGLHAALVVTPPQVAILGAGRIHDAVLAVSGAPAVRRVLPLSLTFDHRVVTGGEATRFMSAVIDDLEMAE